MMFQLFRIHFLYMSKDEVITFLRNSNLTERKWDYKKRNYKIKPLGTMLAKTSAYLKSYDGQT